ncbi:beta-ketoacyl synthase chain length factor [Luteimonas sp. MC1895]|uniref:beta-ketoacyl synthase chain length factor n=1 Tax=Luteimonas sp. MC1895 TaxID=2819513 RepID=UPI0018F05C72|nr:beta-ketoacyl synthase chain length factor [Luteimonas sp. MC1895]MBJ6979072.1 beta-ketoacyl synthase chain length factor [Luteimonas sp. MC1895]
MNTLAARIEGIGFWAPGLPSWDAARAHVREATPPGDTAKPSPKLLAPNERRRAPPSVAVALEVALAACEAAGRDPAALPSVFASTHGDLAITDYMCATLADDPRAISPTKFHNSVHNAAAGYWTIGAGCLRPATALSAHRASFAQGLIEALAQLACGDEAVLLAAYDTEGTGPLGAISESHGLLGGALVLAACPESGLREAGDGVLLRATLVDADAPTRHGPLARHGAGNAMAPMLPLFDALAGRGDLALLHAGHGRTLRVELAHG